MYTVKQYSAKRVKTSTVWCQVRENINCNSIVPSAGKRQLVVPSAGKIHTRQVMFALDCFLLITTEKKKKHVYALIGVLKILQSSANTTQDQNNSYF